MKSSPDNTEKIVGIFQHNEYLDIHFFNLAFNLSQHFTVYVFTLNQNLAAVKQIDLSRLPNVIFKNYHQKDFALFQPRRMLSKLNLIERQPHFLWELSKLINREGIGFDYMFGVEKKGLALMHMISAPDAIKIYYSLEIYDKLQFEVPFNFKKLRELEMKFHSKCDYTIIQDHHKARIIADYNNVDFDAMKWIYLPVSVKGGINQKKSAFLHERFNIEAGKKIILNFGMLVNWRHSGEVGRVLNEMKRDYTSIVHGYGDKKIIDELRTYKNIILSEDLVKESELNELISSAYIGISIYDNVLYNDKLTIHSSERNARYCQNGVPFICLLNEETDQVYKQLQYFEMVNKVHEIPAAIDKIHMNYEFYRQNAFKAFSKYYSFDTNFNVLLNELN